MATRAVEAEKWGRIISSGEAAAPEIGPRSEPTEVGAVKNMRAIGKNAAKMARMMTRTTRGRARAGHGGSLVESDDQL
jgi:hypothetical protein